MSPLPSQSSICTTNMLMDLSAGPTSLDFNSRAEAHFLLGKGSIIFLKDSCPSRSNDTGMEKSESVSRRDINKNFYETVPEPTIDGRLGGMVQRVHIRFARTDVGYPLESFKSSREFLLAVFDAFLAHRDAYEKCGIVHGDISPGNIFIRRNGCGHGLLNGWDIASINPESTPRQPLRSGTWQFMSAALLGKPDKGMSLQDDMESFLWLVLYHILRYMNHNGPYDLRKTMQAIFDEEPDDEGWRRRSVLNLNHRPLGGIEFIVQGNKPLTRWIRTMLGHWRQWYTLVNSNITAIADDVLDLDMSWEEATQRHPFDDSISPMRNHNEAVSVFQKVLEMTPWPESDQALDALSPPVKQGETIL